MRGIIAFRNTFWGPGGGEYLGGGVVGYGARVVVWCNAGATFLTRRRRRVSRSRTWTPCRPSPATSAIRGMVG